MSHISDPKKRIGIYSGSFDPVHKGHVAFALAALEQAKLDKVYFAPESKPRRKANITHMGHRLAMLNLATRLYGGLSTLELPDKYFSAEKTIPRLRLRFPDADLALLVGSDLFENISQWPNIEFLLQNMALIVAVRSHTDVAQTLELATRMPVVIKDLHIIECDKPELASSFIRQSIAAGNRSPDLLPSVNKYAKENWLYDDISSIKYRA